jgi:hypothetical protein
MWLAGGGLRSVSGISLTKSGCSILPIARQLRAGNPTWQLDTSPARALYRRIIHTLRPTFLFIAFSEVHGSKLAAGDVLNNCLADIEDAPEPW